MHQSTTTGASFLMQVQTDSTMDLSDRRLPTFAKHDDPAGSDIFCVLLFGIAGLGTLLRESLLQTFWSVSATFLSVISKLKQGILFLHFWDKKLVMTSRHTNEAPRPPTSLTLWHRRVLGCQVPHKRLNTRVQARFVVRLQNLQFDL